MSSQQNFQPLPGSERQPIRGARLIQNSHPDQVIEVSIRLRSKAEAQRKEFKSALEKPGFKHIPRKDFETAYGADPADLQKIQQFAQEYNLHVQQSDLARRTVVLSGTVADMQRAFNVQLKEYSHPEGDFRGREGAISVPGEYANIIRGVFGLDNRRQAEPHFRRLQPSGKLKAHASTNSFDPNQVAQLYDFPQGNGNGQCVGIIELGGGFSLDDLNTYFTSLGITPVPQVISVSVDGGQNSPGDPNGADDEVMLDIEVVGAVAPAAKIVVYFAPNTDRGFLDAITTAVHDNTNQPSVISISWGSAESQWTEQALTNFDEAFQGAAAIGVTVCVASGDNGSADGVNDGANHVDFPASDPFALGCGGTSLQASGGQIVSETVWNDLPNGGAGGGGFSSVFTLPSYQQNLGIQDPNASENGRGVPDVAGDADPDTGYNVLVDGQSTVIGGTSAVAPLWAGLVALMNAVAQKPVGYLNPQIYTQAVESAGFNDITQGNNGAFSAGPGWDPCTGLGSPIGAQLLAALAGQPASQPAAQSPPVRTKKTAA